ncbi:hypothetical protein BGZ95_003405 [Linnemannia exigua]|uniref:P-loop containing nucleoside triphosphate hydrolase protein n=1 Tax=Linnemannia exigua TaxID=604196 RepID=A0AAD4HAD6_9FUNG|nr:hypothetical protein BGZ95_003405 [Linnemannia exigua]
MLVLGQTNLDALRTPLQMKLFLQSCLLNLSNHHTVDTSGVLYSLASETGLAKLRHIMQQPVSIEASNEISSGTVSFQNVILPLIGVMTRQSVCQTTLTQESNLIYRLVQEHSQQFLGTSVLLPMQSLLSQGLPQDSFSAPSVHSLLNRQHHPDHQSSLEAKDPLKCALLAIVRLFYQLVMRFPCSDPQMVRLIKELSEIVKLCLQQKRTRYTQVDYLDSALVMDTKRLLRVVKDRVSSRRDSGTQPVQLMSSTSISSLAGPGDLAPHGPRHDNDNALIENINVLPTREEILCRDEAYLPINDIREPSTHFLPHGWSRHLDVHFRLYRQDMLKPLCAGIQEFVDLLGRTDTHDDRNLADPRELRRLINGNVSLNVYSNVAFRDVSTEGFEAGLITISFDQPIRIKGVTAYQDRRDYWERSRGRLMQGGLVCMVKRGPQTGYCSNDVKVVLAIVRERDLHELSKYERNAFIQVSLTNTKSYPMVFTPPRSNLSDHGCWFMIECPGSYFESYRPVLKALQTKLPSTLPFGKYIAFTGKDAADPLSTVIMTAIDPPRYATTPKFKFDLSVLLRNGGICQLDVRDKSSVDRAVTVLREHSSLDNTQGLALVEALGREIALINGPPGTGKTKIGIDLMRVLLDNKQATRSGPILVICYTNHALDQFLEHIVIKGYTKVVRLGSQSKSPLLQEYNLKSIMDDRIKPYAARRVIAEAFQVSERAAKIIRDLTLALKSGYFEWKHVKEYLSIENPAQHHQFEVSAPSPIVCEDDDDEELLFWSSQLSGKHAYERWATGKDIVEKRLWNQHADEKDRKRVRPTNIFASLDEDSSKTVATRRYEIPLTDRPLSLLGGDVWSMSMVERRRLIESWSPEIIHSIEEELERHRQSLEASEERKYSGYDELRRLIMSGMDVIGMTTSGSAKYHKLLESVAPKIIMCEEAGEVLESHILTALSSCTQHLILIGDHLQLRPQVQTFSLTSESSEGKKYNLDRSLFERLVTSKPNPLPMSRLTIQRRMRPEISSLIRNTLYPTLEDGGPVHRYPDVSGMGANLFFMNHSHTEDKKDPFGAQSFANKFEVDMIEALALYLIKNGYNQPGDIAILTPYLGQLVKIRDKLKDQCVVLVDERDQETLDELGVEGVTGTSQRPQSSKKSQQSEAELQNHLTIRTIDNYQGEEAKIVIVSLVRNDVGPESEALPGSIGFLKSPNRTNVLLSRAQHGMFLIGNARLMAQPNHGIWPAVIRELTETGRLGPGLPIACKNHPETRRSIDSPEDFQALAPEGGCTLPCGRLLECGHFCPRSSALRSRVSESQMLAVVGPFSSPLHREG